MQIGLLVGLAAFVPDGAAAAPAARAGSPTGTSCWPPACCCPPFAPWKQAVITCRRTYPAAITAPQPAAAPAPRTRHPADRDRARGCLAPGCVVRLGWLATGFWRLRPYRAATPCRSAPPHSWSVRGRYPRLRRHLQPGDLRRVAPRGAAAGAISPNSTRPRRRPFSAMKSCTCAAATGSSPLAEELVRCVFWFHPGDLVAARRDRSGPRAGSGS